MVRVVVTQAQVSARAADMKEGASALASTAFDSTRDLAAEAATATRNAAASATDASLEMARSVRNKTSDLSNRAGRTVLDTIQENPLLVAGVGLLIGGLIASALPKSELEDDKVDERQLGVEGSFDFAKDKPTGQLSGGQTTGERGSFQRL